MTVKQELKTNLIEIGKIIRNHRADLMLPKSSRDYFIQDRVAMHLLPADWLSEKSLTNIENGRNLPSIVTLKALSAALEVDFIDLIKEIEPYLY